MKLILTLFILAALAAGFWSLSQSLQTQAQAVAYTRQVQANTEAQQKRLQLVAEAQQQEDAQLVREATRPARIAALSLWWQVLQLAGAVFLAGNCILILYFETYQLQITLNKHQLRAHLLPLSRSQDLVMVDNLQEPTRLLDLKAQSVLDLTVAQPADHTALQIRQNSVAAKNSGPIVLFKDRDF